MNFIRSTSETMTSFQATLVNTGFGQLVLRDSLGKVAQKWTLANPKCVIGTGTNCNVSCQLPGISDHHVLMVVGARQVFIRALAPGLTRNGQNITELVIPGSEPAFDFEIAGHHFQFARDGVSTPITKEFVQESATARPLFAPAVNDAPVAAALPTTPVITPVITPVSESLAAPVSTVNTSAVLTPSSTAFVPSRLKFTVVRALEKNRQSSPDMPAVIDNGLTTGRPAWVEAIVRDALRPVEERLDDLNGPLQNIERRLRRQRAQLRKSRKQSPSAADALSTGPQFVPVLAPEMIQSQAIIEQSVQKHSSQLEKVTLSVGQIVARLNDVDRQLTTSQSDRQELAQQFQQSHHQIAAMQQEMLALFNGLQSQLKQPVAAEPSSQVRLWQSNVEAQLAELQATLLALDDIKTTLQAAVEQNRMLKGDLEAQQQKLGKIVTESTQKAIADALAQSNNDSETIGQLVGDKVCDNLREQLGARFTNEIAQQLSDSLNNEFALPLTSQLTSQISTQLTSELTRQLSQVTPPAAAAPDNDHIVQALRETLTEMLAPLAGTLQSTLQSSLQQSIQQAVDQSLQQSLQQSVEQTIAPMLEAATTAQVRAVAALPQFQLPHVVVNAPLTTPSTAPAAPAASTPLSGVSEIQQVVESPQFQPATRAALNALSTAANSALENSYVDQSITPANNSLANSQAYVAPTDPSQGFDSQPYQSPGFDIQPAADSQPYSQPAYDSQAYQHQAYDSQASDSQAYDSQASDSQAYDSQAYDSQAYDSQAYDSQANPVQAYDSQEYVPDSQLLAYDSRSYDPQTGFAAVAPTTQPATANSPEPAPADSHAQELPSWWSDDAVAEQPASGDYQIGADDDALYRDQSHFPTNKNIATEASQPSAVSHDNGEQYASSAFSAEQLELGATDEDRLPAVDAIGSSFLGANSQANAYAEDAYDSVPYSELVNRRPAADELSDAEQYAAPSEYVSDSAPYDRQGPDSELVPVGASGEYASEDYQEYLSDAYSNDAYDNLAQPEQLTQSAPVADNPTVPASEAKSGEDTDESVEDYMRRLLARMRGVSESEVTIPGTPAEKPASAVKPKDPSAVQPAPVAEAEDGEQLSEAWTEPFDPDKYVPRGTAPEKNRDLNALRELANTSARSAIQVSARRRQGSAILIKSAIALVGLIAGIALVSINGARINIAFIATVASFLVAIIWGYDATTSIRPLVISNRHHSHQKRESDKADKAEEAN